jgi:hypothetical protein
MLRQPDPVDPLPGIHPPKKKPGEEERRIHPTNLPLLTLFSPLTIPTETDIHPIFRATHADQTLITSYLQLYIQPYIHSNSGKVLPLPPAKPPPLDLGFN